MLWLLASLPRCCWSFSLAAAPMALSASPLSFTSSLLYQQRPNKFNHSVHRHSLHRNHHLSVFTWVLFRLSFLLMLSSSINYPYTRQTSSGRERPNQTSHVGHLLHVFASPSLPHCRPSCLPTRATTHARRPAGQRRRRRHEKSLGLARSVARWCSCGAGRPPPRGR